MRNMYNLFDAFHLKVFVFVGVTGSVKTPCHFLCEEYIAI